MPAYDYDCAACGRRFEVVHGVHAERPTTCPLCGKGPVRKAISAAAVHYRGSGWAKKERRATASSGSSEGDRRRVVDRGGECQGGQALDRRAHGHRPAPPAKPAETGATSKTD